VVRHDFLLAFVHALQPVFLVGAAVTAVAFLLALVLKDEPLRATTYADADVTAAAVAAGGEAVACHPPRPVVRS
jgi:hypothetical protein